MAEKQLITSIFVASIGLIILGIGVNGLGSLPYSISPQVMGPSMMKMMPGPMIGQSTMINTPLPDFGMNPSLVINGYIITITTIYFGLIGIGGYTICRVVSPLVKELSNKETNELSEIQ